MATASGAASTRTSRTRLYPALAVFDAPDADLVCTCRRHSNTRRQALTRLNDQAFLEIAESFAARVHAHTGEDGAKLQFASRYCVARQSKASGLDRLTKILETERAADGASSPDVKREHGVWLTVARVRLNLDETIT